MVDAVAGAGAGGARKRMKLVKFCVTLVIPPLDELVSKSVTSSGSLLKLQPEAMAIFRSVGNNSLVTPISTLYASPENISMDLFCAFHPNLVMVPSLGFRFS